VQQQGIQPALLPPHLQWLVLLFPVGTAFDDSGASHVLSRAAQATGACRIGVPRGGGAGRPGAPPPCNQGLLASRSRILQPKR